MSNSRGRTDIEERQADAGPAAGASSTKRTRTRTRTPTKTAPPLRIVALSAGSGGLRKLISDLPQPDSSSGIFLSADDVAKLVGHPDLFFIHDARLSKTHVAREPAIFAPDNLLTWISDSRKEYPAGSWGTALYSPVGAISTAEEGFEREPEDSLEGRSIMAIVGNVTVVSLDLPAAPEASLRLIGTLETFAREVINKGRVLVVCLLGPFPLVEIEEPPTVNGAANGTTTATTDPYRRHRAELASWKQFGLVPVQTLPTALAKCPDLLTQFSDGNNFHATFLISPAIESKIRLITTRMPFTSSCSRAVEIALDLDCVSRTRPIPSASFLKRSGKLIKREQQAMMKRGGSVRLKDFPRTEKAGNEPKSSVAAGPISTSTAATPNLRPGPSPKQTAAKLDSPMEKLLQIASDVDDDVEQQGDEMEVDLQQINRDSSPELSPDMPSLAPKTPTKQVEVVSAPSSNERPIVLPNISNSNSEDDDEEVSPPMTGKRRRSTKKFADTPAPAALGHYSDEDDDVMDIGGDEAAEERRSLAETESLTPSSTHSEPLDLLSGLQATQQTENLFHDDIARTPKEWSEREPNRYRHNPVQQPHHPRLDISAQDRQDQGYSLFFNTKPPARGIDQFDKLAVNPHNQERVFGNTQHDTQGRRTERTVQPTQDGETAAEKRARKEREAQEREAKAELRRREWAKADRHAAIANSASKTASYRAAKFGDPSSSSSSSSRGVIEVKPKPTASKRDLEILEQHLPGIFEAGKKLPARSSRRGKEGLKNLKADVVMDDPDDPIDDSQQLLAGPSRLMPVSIKSGNTAVPTAISEPSSLSSEGTDTSNPGLEDRDWTKDNRSHVKKQLAKGARVITYRVGTDPTGPAIEREAPEEAERRYEQANLGAGRRIGSVSEQRDEKLEMEVEVFGDSRSRAERASVIASRVLVQDRQSSGSRGGQ